MAADEDPGSEDSRTAIVGRRLRPVRMDISTANAESSSDDGFERPSKRIKVGGERTSPVPIIADPIHSLESSASEKQVESLVSAHEGEYVPAQPVAQVPEQKAALRWNKGVMSNVRTSFGDRLKKQISPKTRNAGQSMDLEKNNGKEEQIEEVDEELKAPLKDELILDEAPEAKPYEMGAASLVGASSTPAANLSELEVADKPEFEQLLPKETATQISASTRSLDHLAVPESLEPFRDPEHVHDPKPLTDKQEKRTGRQTKDSAVSPESATADPVSNTSELDSLHGETRLKDSEIPQENEQRAVSLDPEIRKKELELNQRYFAPVNGVPAKLRCLSCAETTHSTFDCPAFTCNICGGSHTILQCKKNALCSKCRQRGHLASECSQKLRPARNELSCGMCGASDHEETSCHLIWRSYVRPENFIPRANIPVYCFECGGHGHYGGECGLQKGQPSIIWTRPGREKGSAPSLLTTAPPTHRPRGDLSIKGKANDPIMVDESDDDGEFIRPKVNNAPAQRKRDYGRGSGQQKTVQPSKPAFQQFDTYDRGVKNLHGQSYSTRQQQQLGNGAPASSRMDSSRNNHPQTSNNQNGTFRFEAAPPLPSGPPPPRNGGRNAGGNPDARKAGKMAKKKAKKQANKASKPPTKPPGRNKK